MKNVAVLTEDGAFALFFRPHPGGFDSSRVPTLGNLPSKAKNDNTWGSARGGGGWAQLELTDALCGSCHHGFLLYISFEVLLYISFEVMDSSDLNSPCIWSRSISVLGLLLLP